MAKLAKKRLIFCTYPSLYSSLVLNKLLADDSVDVVGIVSSTRKLKKNRGALYDALKHIRLSGWRYSTYLFLVTDLFSLFSSLFILVGRSSGLKTVASLAKHHAIPLLESSDINSVEALQFVKSQSANVLLAAHFNQLIKSDLLNFPELHCINIHPSLLPDYKGVDPVFYAMLDNKQEVGVSVHEITEQFDTGNILAQTSLPIEHNGPKNSVFMLNCDLFEYGATLALDLLRESTESVQQQAEGRYDSWPTPQQVTKCRKQGVYLIHFSDYLSRLQKRNN